MLQSLHDSIQSLYALSVVHCYRNHLTVDALFRAEIDERGLDGDLLRRIALVYNVNRGVSAGPENADRLAGFLTAEAERFAGSLTYKACHCARLADEMQARGMTKHVQRSAVSKFMWFLRPDGWTVYDDFARRALGVSAQLGAPFERFYAELDSNDFTGAVAAIRAALNNTDFAMTPPERVIDACLWLAGAPADRRAFEQRASATFLQTLPAPMAASLQDLADRIAANDDARLTLHRGKP
jgi:hypothetical protein